MRFILTILPVWLVLSSLSYSASAQIITQLGSDIDGEAAGNHSGKSVAISADGQHIAVGAIYNNDNGVASGHVRVHQWSNGAWQQLGIDLDGEAAGDYSGYSVSLSRQRGYGLP